MKEKSIYEVIEEVNEDYLMLKFRSDKIENCFNYIKQFRIILVLRKFLAYLFYKKKFMEETFLPKIHTPSLGKVVVYTCISGPYDLPKEPLLPEPGVDYIIYTDQPKVNQDTVWQFRDIPLEVLNLSSNGKVHNEYLRTHPHEFLGDYDYSIYIDGNIKIMSDISVLTNLISPISGIAMHPGVIGNCVYYESKILLLVSKGRAKEIRNQVKFYRDEGMPENLGNLQTGLIVTDLKNLLSRKIFDFWWNDFYKWNSQRDQLSIPYVLWKMGLTVKDIGTLSGNIFKNTKIRIYQHEMRKYHER